MRMNTRSFLLILSDQLQKGGAQKAPLPAYLASLDPTACQEVAKRALRDGEEFPSLFQGVHLARVDRFPHGQYLMIIVQSLSIPPKTGMRGLDESLIMFV